MQNIRGVHLIRCAGAPIDLRPFEDDVKLAADGNKCVAWLADFGVALGLIVM